MSEQIAISLSNLNLPQKTIAFGGAEAHRQTLCEIGVEHFPGGYEITPTRALAASLLVESIQNNMELEANGVPFITALHQSWGPGLPRGLARSLQQRSPGPVVRSAVMTESDRSLQIARRLMCGPLGRLPGVVYGEKQREGSLIDFIPYGFTECGTQVRPELYSALEEPVDSEGVPYKLAKRGIRHLVVGTHHLQGAAEDNPNNRLDPNKVLDAIEASGPPVGRIHIEVARIDAKHREDRDRSFQDLYAILQGPQAMRKTVMGDILARSYDLWRSHAAKPESERVAHPVPDVLPVTLVVPYAGLGTAIWSATYHVQKPWSYPFPP